ncbi:GntR family transcriptional regulator [Actinoallomurus sp. NPDC050550]|uniref:GntR family transcriptional regulator n=1 Tax=Actinoallomurus sp. NPDC050550 TaxID=3154937 RepID=UPI003401AC95
MAPAPYRDIERDLERRIDAGEWAAGEALPRMEDLARDYGVSRNSIARAVKSLADKGKVWSVPRRGTIVRPAMRRRVLRGNLVKRNTRHVAADGSPTVGGYSFPAAGGGELWIHHVTPTVTEEPITDPRLADFLKVPVGSLILRRRRVTGPPGEPPFQRSDTWIHPRGVVDAPDVAEPLGSGPGAWIDRLEETGHGPIEWVEFHRARLPDADEATQLEIPKGLPVQEIVRVGYSAKDEKAIEVTQVVIPSDRVEEVVHIKRDASAAWPHRDAGPDGPPLAR